MKTRNNNQANVRKSFILQMATVSLLIVSILAYSCSSDALEDFVEEEPSTAEMSDFERDSLGICEGNGQAGLPPSWQHDQPRIAQMESMRINNKNDIYTFQYDENGLPAEVTRLSEPYYSSRKYKLHFQDSKLRSIETYRFSSDSIPYLSTIDSLLYNEAGGVSRVYEYYEEDGALKPRRRQAYFYNENNALAWSRTFSYITNTYSGYGRFCWDSGNLIRARSYDEDGRIWLESNYEFDDKLNYQKLNPLSFIFIVSWNKNNSIAWRWRDYVGNLDFLCGNPCFTRYQYNEEDYPIGFATSIIDTTTINYE